MIQSLLNLALIAAQLVRTGGKALQQEDDRYAKAAESAHKLWTACNTYFISTRKVELGATEKVRETRRHHSRNWV